MHFPLNGKAAAAIDFFFYQKKGVFFLSQNTFQALFSLFLYRNGNQVPLKGEHLG